MGTNPRLPRQRYAATLGDVVTTTRGSGRGEKHFQQAIPSNCEISHCDGQIKLEGHKGSQFTPTAKNSWVRRMQACLRDALIIYAVRIVIYSHCISIAASRHTNLWGQIRPWPTTIALLRQHHKNPRLDHKARKKPCCTLEMPNYFIPQSPFPLLRTPYTHQKDKLLVLEG